jgi:hypothetical protein
VHWDVYEMSIGDAGQCIGICMRSQHETQGSALGYV